MDPVGPHRILQAYRILLDPYWIPTVFSWVLLDPLESYCILQCPIGSSWILLGSDWILLDPDGPFRTMQDPIGSPLDHYWIVLGPLGSYWILLNPTASYNVYWLLLDPIRILLDPVR